MKIVNFEVKEHKELPDIVIVAGIINMTKQIMISKFCLEHMKFDIVDEAKEKIVCEFNKDFYGFIRDLYPIVDNLRKKCNLFDKEAVELFNIFYEKLREMEKRICAQKDG